MNFFQITLAFIAGIFLSISIFHFARSLFVVRKIDKYFYLFLISLFSFLYVIFQLVGSNPVTDETALLAHRIKLMSLGLGLIFWVYLIFDICFKSKLFAHIFAIVSLIIITTIGFDIYLSYPIQILSGNIAHLGYEYRLGQAGIMYTIHSMVILVFVSLTVIAGIFTKIGIPKKVFLVVSTLPIIGGALHDYAVIFGLIENIMLSEFLMLFFILLVFILFIIDEFKKYEKLIHNNLEMEVKVKNRTRDLEALNKKLKIVASTDSLTGLKNRLEMENKIIDEIKRALRYHKKEDYVFSILFIDLDNFKYFNDSFGHLVGDILLKKFAELLEDQIRDIDHAGRFGGDEFVVILPETPSKEALHLVKRIQRGITQREHFLPAISRYIEKSHLIPQSRKLSCSIGISEFSTQNKKNLKDLLREADDALYMAKRNGKNQAIIWAQH